MKIRGPNCLTTADGVLPSDPLRRLLSPADAAFASHFIMHASSSFEILHQAGPTFEGSVQSPRDMEHLPEPLPVSGMLMVISYRKRELTHWLQPYFMAFYQLKDNTLRGLEIVGNSNDITLEERSKQKYPRKYKISNL